MRCRLVEVEQGSDEWHELRAGKITASRLGDVIADPATKRYKGYMAELLKEMEGADPITVSDSPRWAEHGKQNEPMGIKAYEWKHEVDVVHDVFCISEEFDWLACSPDGLVLEDGEIVRGMELKCRSRLDTYIKSVTYVRDKGQAEPTYKPQLQGSMLVTGLDRWDYSNYLPLGHASKLYVQTTFADELYQKMLIDKALTFRAELMKRFGGLW